MRKLLKVNLQLIKVRSQLTSQNLGMVKDTAENQDLLTEISPEGVLVTETEAGESMGPETGTGGGHDHGGGGEKDHLLGEDQERGHLPGEDQERGHLREEGRARETEQGDRTRSDGGGQGRGGDTEVPRRDP